MNILKIRVNDLYVINCESENIDINNSVTLEPYEKMDIEINNNQELIVGDYKDCRRLLIDFCIEGNALNYMISELTQPCLV
jgi:hypothetical protein